MSVLCIPIYKLILLHVIPIKHYHTFYYNVYADIIL